MSKYAEPMMDASQTTAKNRSKNTRKKVNPMGSSGAQKLLEDDRQKNPAAVQATTEALIDEGFLPSRQLLEVGFLDDDLYDCLIRMDKKDSATKLKALGDFLQIVPGKSVEKLRNTRTFWARLFTGYMEDEDPRVRELACRCQEQYVTILKKDILTVLKTIAGPWWLAQYQLHSAASNAARSSFNAAFPENKRPDVLRVCCHEIFLLLKRRIVKPAVKTKPSKGQPQDSTGQSMSDDQQQKVAEALDALGGFVGAVHEDGLVELKQEFGEMFDKVEFWRLSKLQNPKARQCFFAFLGAVWERMEGVPIKPYLKEGLTAVIGNLHERDIRAATATWEVLLLILSKNSTWSTAIDVQKTLLPKFMSFLKNAGFGTAASIHPLVVVLIDKLPEKSPEILDSCVAALIHGLSVENVRHTDTIAICRAICDIFNYIGKKHLDLSAECVDRHFSPLVENSLLGSSNAIRGIDLLLRVLLNWLTGGKGDICRVCARKVFRGMADKVMYLAPNDLAGVRVQQWITGLVEAGKSVQSGRDGSTRSRVIEEEVDLQDLLYHILRLSFLLSKNSNDPEAGRTFLIFIRSISAPLLMSRLKTFLEDSPTDLSPERIIFQQLPIFPTSSTYLDILCQLFSTCNSGTDCQEMFTRIWISSADKVFLLQVFEKHRCFFLIEKCSTADQINDLVVLAENLMATEKFGNVGSLVDLIVRLNGDMAEAERRFLRKIAVLKPRKKLEVLLVLLMVKEAKWRKIDLSAILAAFQLARREKKSLDVEMDLIQNVGKILVKKSVDLMDEKIVNELRDILINAATNRVVVENLAEIFVNLFKESAAAKSAEIAKLCGSFVDFGRIMGSILQRSDMFVLRINSIQVSENLGFENKFWDRSMEEAVNVCVFALSVLEGFGISGLEEVGKTFWECVSVLKAYLDLAFGSGAPVVHQQEMFAEIAAFREKLQTFLRLLPEGSVASSSLCNTQSMKSLEFHSEVELVSIYADLWKTENLSTEQTDYRNSVRDRLEAHLAFVDFPRNSATIQATPWTQIQLYRIIPSLLSERSVDPDYSGPVLDVFGTVMIDWIGCLSEPNWVLNSPKVVVLVEEALEGVGNLLKAVDVLKDSGILWVELTEFSFPRILASLLDGVLRCAEESEEYLKDRHPLVGRLIATMCGVLDEFVIGSQSILKAVWETLFHLEEGLPPRLSFLHTSPTQMATAFIRLFSPLLLHKVAHFQLLAASILAHILPSFPPSYQPPNVPSSPGAPDQPESAVQLAPPVELLSVLEEAGDVVDTMLHDVGLGSSFGGVVPHTDAYTYVLGYLAAWRSIFAWIKAENDEGRQAFARFLDTNGSFNTLLDNLVRLLPIDVLIYGDVIWLENLQKKLTNDYLLKFVGALSDMEDWSHVVYTEALQSMPMLARSWYSRKQGPLVRSINQYTVKFVSGGIVSRELALAAEQAKHVVFDNFKVNVRTSVGEITAEYRVESWVAEIVVKIPKDYPLIGVQVNWGTTKITSMDAWDSWVIRLSGFLRRQNGSILDGILDWKKSVDKKFGGVEACAICLSIVEVKTSQVPQMQCKTCKNKFHNECLYRWFQQQVDPTCPLCREKFFT